MLNLIIKEKSFDKLILEDVNINFKKNKICGLVGLNGSGKTTLLNILLGLDTNFEGYINYLELDKYTFESLCQLFNLEKDKDKLIEQYSYGMKKKIQFITGILLKCKLYIFDELTSGLDIETILLIEKILLSKNATFVVSSHEIDFIERVSDEILLVNNKSVEYIKGDIRSRLTNLTKVEEQYDKIKNLF